MRELQYVVTRTFASRFKKRTYHITVGPFATRARALGFMQRAIRDYGYPEDQLAVGVLRAPHVDDEETLMFPCEAVALEV